MLDFKNRIGSLKKQGGFTLVEILAVIVILGILTSAAIIGVTRYKDKARKNDYDALAKSSYNAMEEYLTGHPSYNAAKLETLEEEQFLSGRIDPGTKNSRCSGVVVADKLKSESGKISDYKYYVYLCCSNYNKIYTYLGGEAIDLEDTNLDKCDTADHLVNPASFNPLTLGSPSDPSNPSDPPSNPSGGGPSSITCDPGYYLPKAKDICKICEVGFYCPGGTFTIDNDKDQGRELCPGCYEGSAEGSSKVTQCYVDVNQNYYVKEPKVCQSNCPNGYESSPHRVYYENTSSCKQKDTPTITVDVTFNCNGGTGGGTQRFTYGKSGQKFSKTCTRSGYKLVGWKNKADGSGDSLYKIDSGVSDNWIKQTAPKFTVYAHWEKAQACESYKPGTQCVGETMYVCRSAQTSPPYRTGNTYVKIYHLHEGDKRHYVGQNIGTMKIYSPVKITGYKKITYKGEEKYWYTYHMLDGAQYIDESDSYDVGIGTDNEHEYMVNPYCLVHSKDEIPCSKKYCIDDMS